mgnify:CR=1 FL=1
MVALYKEEKAQMDHICAVQRSKPMGVLNGSGS